MKSPRMWMFFRGLEGKISAKGESYVDTRTL